MGENKVPPSWAASEALFDVIDSGITISLLSGSGAEVSHRVPGAVNEDEVALSGLAQRVCGSGEVVDEDKKEG